MFLNELAIILCYLFINPFTSILSAEVKLNQASFPDGFLFGVATSAYQIEGGHNANGKGENVWDHYLKNQPNLVRDLSNGNIACDSYNKYQEDVQLVRNLGVDFYRFSISWSRILPTGQANRINRDAIRYYNRLIDDLLANGIQPMITLYHFDLPQKLQEFGGWTNPLMADYFADYARIAFRNFGDRVKYWITFNAACPGYGGSVEPPLIDQSGIADYLCISNTLLAHANVYHLYNDTFRLTQNGQIGITFDSKWFEAASESKDDTEAAERARLFHVGIYMDPILSRDSGDYPVIVRKRVDDLSKSEGFTKSRLPQFTPQEIARVRGTYDFLGINSYTTFLVSDVAEINLSEPSARKDQRIRLSQNASWPRGKSPWLKVVPWGLRKALKWLKNRYDNPVIFVTENGFSDDGRLDDRDRINYYQLHLSALLDAIYLDQVNVRGYAAWSLLDNFEWTAGYTERFGLYHVDFTDSNRTRTAKDSANWYRKVIAKNSLVKDDDNSLKTRIDRKGEL